MPATEIEVSDLDPSARTEWGPDQWVRAYRSGLMVWLHLLEEDPGFAPGPGTPLCFRFQRAAAIAAYQAYGEPAEDGSEDADIDTSDLDTTKIWDWTDDQLARAGRSGLLRKLPDEFWDDLAACDEFDGDEE